jgi:hypothetical protein
MAFLMGKAKLAEIETRITDLERQIRRIQDKPEKQEFYSRGVPSMWGDAGYIKGTEITVVQVLKDLLRHLGLEYKYVPSPPSSNQLVKVTKKGAKHGI